MFLDKIQNIYVLEGLKRLDLIDLNEYRQSALWNSLKANYYTKNKKICKVCHSKKDIHLHHKTYKNLGTPKEINDLTPLCQDCHNNVHRFLEDCIRKNSIPNSLESVTNYIIKLEKRVSVITVEQKSKLSIREKLLEKRMKHQANLDAKKRKEQQKIQKQIDILNAKDEEYKHKKLKRSSKQYKPTKSKEDKNSFTVSYKKRPKPHKPK